MKRAADIKVMLHWARASGTFHQYPGAGLVSGAGHGRIDAMRCIVKEGRNVITSKDLIFLLHRARSSARASGGARRRIRATVAEPSSPVSPSRIEPLICFSRVWIDWISKRRICMSLPPILLNSRNRRTPSGSSGRANELLTQHAREKSPWLHPRDLFFLLPLSFYRTVLHDQHRRVPL
ncbi:hypothetical protein BDW75DRAFT_216896 [Aspergillus navahoensis]